MSSIAERTLSAVIERLRAPTQTISELNEFDILLRVDVPVWETANFVGKPWFYPVYRYRDYYSSSVLALILKKQTLVLNRQAAEATYSPTFRSGADNTTIDAEILRIGGPAHSSYHRPSRNEYVEQIAEAMRDDVREIEEAFPGYTNVILVGGKDSQNPLFLPWKNPVIVASGPPNDTLNKEFLADNQLPYDLISLEDDDLSCRDVEILANSCGSALEHKRWVPHLMRIVNELDGKAILWSGQLGDTFFTPYWKRYKSNRPLGLLDRVLMRGKRSRFSPVVHGLRVSQRRFFASLWTRGAMGEGHHMSIQSQIFGCPALSFYHGPRISSLVQSVSLTHLIQNDIRPDIGTALRGSPVIYPGSNPGPLPTSGKEDWAKAKHFIELMESNGINVIA